MHSASHDPCDSYGDCVSSSVNYIRSNPGDSLYVGDSFSVPVSITTGQNTTSYSVSWSYPPVFEKSGDTFVVAENQTGTFSVETSVTFTGSVTVGNTTQHFSSTLTTSQSVMVIQLDISLHTRLVNVTDTHDLTLRNMDGSFYRNDSFCDAWNASFEFAPQRADIKINVSSLTPPSLRILNYSADTLGRTGRFCYVARTTAAYRPDNITLEARALNWQGVSLALKDASQPFAIVRYDPQFTAYAYMEYRNSTAPSSLERPWVLFVRYDGNEPGYSYAGDANTSPFNGSPTFRERAYFDNFTFTSLSYQPTNVAGEFTYHVVNSTGSLRYRWLNGNSSAMLEGNKRIEKYVFEVEPSSLAPLLGQGFVYQNVTMAGRWTHEAGYALDKNYWLVPSLWSGRVNVVSVGLNGNVLPNTPISITIRNPSPLDGWLTSNFEHVFGDDPQALRAFQEDLYPTNRTMVFTGEGTLSLLLNQTSLVPPEISITAGGVTQSGNFTFVPFFVNSSAMSVPNAFNGTVFHANATIPLWTYNMLQGNLAYLPVSTTIDQPTTFLELVNNGSTGWIAGSTTAPQTPAAFASQEYGFWPMGQNLTVYANLQGGGVDLLGVQRVSPSEYQASFYVGPWSGGISGVQLIEGGHVVENESALNPSAYPSPLLQGLTGLYTVSYPATGQDVKVVFTNLWGAKTTLDLGMATAPPPLTNLVPETTVAAFGIAFLAWLLVSSALKTRRAGIHG
ncbi:MAG: hypothetical protein JRN11_07260 [Nitrososphaerota archaeon]|nr:hypothetical protein [Nitrososphaerota archaeon]MDG7026528.1 hypothetical protein [Nitrososphaerota archaeon]